MTDRTDQVDYRVTVEDLAALMTRTAGVNVDPDVLKQRPDAGFDTLGLDSLGMLGIVAELEKRYGLALPEQMERSKTPAEFLAVVNDVLRKGA
ncbi:acyl carrier protein [Streptomyces sp. NBC_00878]|uniref:acyl carrier protein n=1 Tax=Streptomyces sp. NBC_00878 TaxID=2975854 RepID=UPI00225C09A0|nr:acyl carrier protein [Streptomyces sp. NBC_00878]MCX4911619.1 acyl carrier protein [Streptomyces sp. NBC_00878]